jgi:ubiquinone/menaquinone biosynthesis C-methylase UbiE
MNEDRAKAAIQQQFGKTAEAYVRSATHANQPDLREMVQRAALRGDERVLDIATGGGHTALAFAPHVAEVVATDLTPAMLDAAQRFITGKGVANVRFEHADAEALPFEDRSFDVVTCRVAPHHFGDVALFVREVARVLRPGGRFVLVDNVAPAEPEHDQWVNAVEQLRDPTHVRAYTEAEWRHLCADAGFDVVYTSTWRKTIPFADWVERAQVSAATREELGRRFATASPAIMDAFEITLDGGEVRSFTLQTMLLVATTV